MDNDCILWPGCTSRHGYGRLNNDYAHRFVWMLVNGPAPEGMHVLHRCDRPRCVNPRHLFVGTAGANAADREAKGRGNHAAKVKLGEFVGTSKLTERDVREIRRRAINNGQGRGGNLHKLAKEFGVAHTTVWMVATNRTWKHVR